LLADRDSHWVGVTSIESVVGVFGTKVDVRHSLVPGDPESGAATRVRPGDRTFRLPGATTDMGKTPAAEVTTGERCGDGPRADAGWYPARVVRLH
jgi:hypothetical protein